MAKKRKQEFTTISWERVREIFGEPDPPRQVWERQFDYNDADLKRIAATPYREITRGDLWYYFHDLAYVELQPELFRYLFPVCLMYWHDTLMRDEPCSNGDAEFHYGMCHGQVFQKMLTPEQQDRVVEFFRDSLMQRLDVEAVHFRPIPNSDRRPDEWILRFNSLGFFVHRIGPIWQRWWDAETRGRAIAVLKYCSGLACFDGENKLFGTRDDCWVGPDLLGNNISISGQGWLEPNVAFLRSTLSFDYVLQKVKKAAERLASEPEHDLAEREVAQILDNRELVESRVAELPELLADNGERTCGWSV